MDEEEVVLIEATRGPYAGSRLTMTASEAKQAIADGWAIDPHGPPKPEHVEGEDYDDPTEEQIAKAVEAAEKMARKLRGEPEPKEPKEEKPAKKATTKPVEGEEGSTVPEPAPPAEPTPTHPMTSKAKK